mmetsp:Transcript_90809/g.189852  ORF Transcript_90809/g.189852 Transcript_90809/m.189852 type:complete len:254 (+) Transcript_90809:78-839(+)
MSPQEETVTSRCGYSVSMDVDVGMQSNAGGALSRSSAAAAAAAAAAAVAAYPFEPDCDMREGAEAARNMRQLRMFCGTDYGVTEEDLDLEDDEEEEELQEPDHCDWGSDYTDFAAAASLGTPMPQGDDWGRPTAEGQRVMGECIVGSAKAPTTRKARCDLLRAFARMDNKLLRDRLSHLAEGEYDMRADVDRSHMRVGGIPRQSRGGREGMTEGATGPVAMVTEVQDGPIVFKKPSKVQAAKLNMRRPKEDSD